MTFLKNLAVSLFGFLLFLSLTVFGLAFTVRSTVMNPDFVTNELNNLNIAATVKDFVQIQPTPEIPNPNEIINTTVSAIEPKFKEESGFAIHSVYAYLLGQTQTPDLKSVLKKTYFSTDFVTPLVNSLPISTLAGDAVTQQLTSAISNAIKPAQIPNLDTYIKNALTAAEPDLKQQAITVSGPIFDYLLGNTRTLNAQISLIAVENSLKATLRQVVIDSPPAGLTISGIPVSAIPRDLRGAAFDAYYPTIAGSIPTTYVIDNSVITPQMRTNLTSGIASAEENLAQAKKYVAMFQQYYTLSLILMLVLVLGMILIIRNVKDIAHHLGIPLLTYGAMEYAGILVTKYLISSGRMKFPDLSPQLQAWVLQLIKDSLRPLEIFSLILLIVGVALTVFSFVYKPKQELEWS